MTAYEAEGWHDLFVMTGGAAAALAGLIFVAVSLNHEDILKVPALPALAARTLSILIGIVVLCIVGLTPWESTWMLGLALLGVALVIAAVVFGTTIRKISGSTLLRWKASLVALAVAASVPAVVAGVSVLIGAGGGLYWLMVAIVAGLVVATYNAWILLIEIRR